MSHNATSCAAASDSSADRDPRSRTTDRVERELAVVEQLEVIEKRAPEKFALLMRLLGTLVGEQMAEETRLAEAK